jgi:hypothetical protein
MSTADLGDLSRLSRVELEPVLARCLVVGDDEAAGDVALELSERTWQHTNPYAMGPQNPA